MKKITLQDLALVGVGITYLWTMFRGLDLTERQFLGCTFEKCVFEDCKYGNKTFVDCHFVGSGATTSMQWSDEEIAGICGHTTQDWEY